MTNFEVIVLGASGTYPRPDGACSGFLLRSGPTQVWVDAGPGTFSNLQKHTPYSELRALILSHLHIDHITDLYAFYYALRYSSESKGPTGFEVYAPGKAEDHLDKLVSTTGPDGFGGYFTFQPIKSGDELKMEAFLFRFQETAHPIETMAMRVEAGRRSLVYTADTAPSEAVVELARGVDVLIAEATMQSPGTASRPVHMTAEEAGQMARDAGAKRLVLTHIAPTLDPAVSVEQAKIHFEGEVVAAEDHMRLEV
ncbi:MAG TPA: MBL fold metallo-hydrolase [Actinomycetota bacterium]|nr:MBL fold metallo-hydrolase [Actinomycetota bacterium]